MKLLSAACLFLLLGSRARGQGDNPDFGGSGVIFGTEPDKDVATTLSPEDKPSPEAATTTEEVKDTISPVTSAPAPAAASDADGALPVPENCTGVMCDFEALRQCDAPVLFAKQCCPICPTLDVCDGVTCNESEVCTVHNGRAICCTNLSAPAVGLFGHGIPRRGGLDFLGHDPHGDTQDSHDGDDYEGDDHDDHYDHDNYDGHRYRGNSNGHHRRGFGGFGGYHGRHRRSPSRFGPRDGGRHHYSSADSHLINLRCRYQLPNNCTLRFAKPVRAPIVRGVCANITTCNSTEVCQTKLQTTTSRVSILFFTYHLRRLTPVAKCCMKNRPDCPSVQKPSILGKCHLPGEPIPVKNKTCDCAEVSYARHLPRFFHRFLTYRSGGCDRPGSASEMSYKQVGGRLSRCVCQCARHESFGEHQRFIHHHRNKRCHVMSDVSNVCRAA